MVKEDYKSIDIKRVQRRIRNSCPKETFDFHVDTSKYAANQTEDIQLLYECEQHWESLRDFRTRYLRNCDYNRGRQLEKIILDRDGRRKTQREIVKEQGKTPVVINVIREMVRTVLGQYRQNPSRSVVYARSEDEKTVGEMMTLGLHSALDHNENRELDAQMMEMFLMGGLPVSRITNKMFDDVQEKDVYIENLNPCMLFFNGDIKDVRLNDLRIIGEIIETTPAEVIHTYGGRNPKSIMELEQILNPVSKEYSGMTKGLSKDIYEGDFFTPSEPSHIRIFCVWRKSYDCRILKKDPVSGAREVVKGDLKTTLNAIWQENQMRKEYFLSQGFTEQQALATLIQAETINYSFWEYRILTENGYCIKSGESPYGHKSHPYAIAPYPLINGEVWGLVEDMLDIQDVINQNFMMFKWMVEASAKGLLLVPEDSIPDGMDINDFAEEWSKVGGVIKIKLKAGTELPKEINSVSNQNVKELLNFAISMMDRVSGVHGALRGETPNSGTPSSLYLQMAQNSATSLLDALKRFESYIKVRDTKVLKNAVQLYKTGRWVDLFGESVLEDAKRWNAEKVNDIPFKLVVTSGVDSPVYRMIMEEQLGKLFYEAQAIDMKTYLKKSTYPFANELLAEVERKEQEAAEQTQE
jgi:hypothetical protein